MKTILLALFAGILAAGCGGKVVVDQDPAETDPDAQACMDGGGTWDLDGCAGRGDVCNNGVCLDGFGRGCHCAGDACWDPAQHECVMPTP